MELTARKGYIHALEGVIAALIVVIYLNSIVGVPGTTDWETTRLSKQSEDILSALDRSGFLDRVVMRGDVDSFNAMVDELESGLSYSVRVSGLPRQFIDVGVMANNSSTFRATTAPGDGGATGLPASEDGRYRQGTLADTGEIGDVPFVLSDTEDNGLTRFTTVNFDFDGDDDYGEPGEGPHRFSDRFSCDGGVSGCSGRQTYEVGPFNTTLVLYNASTAAVLARTLAGFAVGERSVDVTFDTFNPVDESVERFDVLWVEGWDAESIAQQRSRIDRFLQTGRLLLVHAPVSKPALDTNYLGSLGFDYLNQYSISGTGSTANVLYSPHGPRNESYRAAQYFLDAGVRFDGFTDAGGHDAGTMTVRGTEVAVKRWDDAASFSAESFAVNHSVGEPVVIEGNAYRLRSLTPLVLAPTGQQRFASFDTGRIDADYHLTRMAGRTYNITAYDTTAAAPDRFQNLTDLPQEFEDGPVNTQCDWRDEPYRMGDVTIGGTTYDFLLVNFQPSTPCDAYTEFMYVDLNGDGDFDDGSFPSPYGEGPYQDGYRINISGNPYTVSPHLDGTGVDFHRAGQRLVGEIPVSRDVLGQGGAAALVRRNRLGHDDMALLTALMAQETQETQSFTAPRSLGESSLGYTYTSSAGTETSFGYTLETVWWFQ
ncbi:MAG: hypothetical protein SVU88_00785 [Candidatus Nanohaloarchaea archaeon]|nr:hypothetical protein [Candidatus Nanohaloarchaea archaeon]